MLDSRPIRIAACAILFLAGLMLPSAAFAQQEGGQNPEGFGAITAGFVATTSTSTSGTTAVKMRTKKLKKKRDVLQNLVLIDTYLDEQEHTVRFDLALASGDSLKELAMIMGREKPLGASEYARFRAHRADFVAALDIEQDDDLTRARAIYAILLPIVHPDTAQLVEAAE